MASRNRRTSQMPEVNLVPMMDVLMTVLTFFIIISMTLRGQQMANIDLPGVEDPANNEAVDAVDDKVPALVVGLDVNGQLLIENEPVTAEELAQAMAEHYTEHADGIVLLKADRGLSFREVSQALKAMRDIGGDRVSLAIGSGS